MADTLLLSEVQISQILLIAGYFKREPKKKAGNTTVKLLYFRRRDFTI